MTQDQMIAALEQIVADAMASGVDANDKPIIGPKGRQRAKRVTAEMLRLIEKAGFEITPVF
jgi:hypothetical protein